MGLLCWLAGHNTRNKPTEPEINSIPTMSKATKPEIIQLYGGEYIWEDVPNKGRCLVPCAPKPAKAKPEEVRHGRTYRSAHGWEFTIFKGYAPDNNNGTFYGIMKVEGKHVEFYSGCSFFSRPEMAKHLNENCGFKEWVD